MYRKKNNVSRQGNILQRIKKFHVISVGNYSCKRDRCRTFSTKLKQM